VTHLVVDATCNRADFQNAGVTLVDPFVEG